MITLRTLRRATAALFIFVAFWMGATARAQGSDDLSALYQQVNQLYQAGKYAEAADVAKRALALAERQSSPEVGTALSYLAWVYSAQSHYADAEPLFKRSLAIHEKAFGSNNLYVERDLHNLAGVYKDQGRSPRLSRCTSKHSRSPRRRSDPTTRASAQTSPVSPSCIASGSVSPRPSPS
jgi:tetratricopeptide (TPR) repeat protein